MAATSITQLMYVDSTGCHIAQYQEFYDWIVAKYQGIYGADIYVDPDSQDGQFLSILGQAFQDTGNFGLSIYNSFSPLTAQGYGLARLVQINGLKKEVSTFSTVTLSIGGVDGTAITNGIAQDSLNQNWILPATVTIPMAGTIDVVATAAVAGAVFANIGTVTNIFTPTNGWQTVTNAGPASPGNAVESDAALRVRQAVSTSIPALTVLDATVGALQNLAGTEQNGVIAYDNDTNTSDGVTGIPAHTVCFVIASSAASSLIAQTIQKYKTPGTGTFGSVNTIVFDSQGMPVTINYQPVVTKSLQVTINLTRAQGWSTNSISIIQQAIANFIAVQPIGCGSKIGANGIFYYTTLFPPAYDSVPGRTFDITSLTIGINGGGQSASNITIDFDWQLVTNPSVDVTVNVT